MEVLSDKELQKKIDFHPHKAQQEILDSILTGKRDIRIAAGRRFGKSKLCAYLVLRYLLIPEKRIWIVAPTYDLTQKIFDYLTLWVRTAFPNLADGISTRPTPQIIRPDNTGWVKCKSSENPDGLLGEELDLVVIDEVSRIKKNIWEMYIDPCTTTRRGKSVMISTPFGQNWFFQEWLKAKQSEDGASFQFPSIANPTFPRDEWERTKNNLPERIFRQEYTASFEPDTAGIFRNIRDCIGGDVEDSIPGKQYILGVDLGKFHDFTVIVVVDKLKRKVVYFERFKNIDWKFQRARIKAAADRYNRARIVIDSSGKGDPVTDELESDGYIVDAYRIKSNRTKRQLVEKLSIFIDQKKITYPAIEVLIDELESYTYNLTPSGVIQYQAPIGLYDDCVMALALAVWGLSGKEKNLTPVQEEIIKIQRQNKKALHSYK